MDFQQTTGYTDSETAKSIGKMLNADCVKNIPKPNYFVGTWQGSSNETDDTYEIVLDEKNKCAITLITADEFGDTMELKGTGSYSYDANSNMFRLDHGFPLIWERSKKSAGEISRNLTNRTRVSII